MKNIEYKIGDVSRILNISNEMLRYYEKHNAIHPTRDENNQYRIYTIFDIFSLLECMQFKQWDMTLKDIFNIRKNEFNDNYVKKLDIYENYLDNEITYLTLMKDRVYELKKGIESVKFNKNNYWIKKIPKRYSFFFVSGNGDEYERIEIDQQDADVIFSDRVIPFIDSYVTWKKDKQNWTFAINKKYFEKLNLPNLCNPKVIEEQYCLCTIIDIGPLGKFDSTCYLQALEYANSKGLEIIGDIRGNLLGRGVNNGEYSRYMELQIPINPESI